MKRLIKASKSLGFERREGLGLNYPVLKLSNGDEVQLTMSAYDRGDEITNLPTTSDMEDHFYETFCLEGVGRKEYLVTREVICYAKDAPVKGPRFKSKIINVQEA